MTTFVDKNITISSVSRIDVDGWDKAVVAVIFTGKCDYWSTAKKDLSETDLSRDTKIQFKDVTIDWVVNNVQVGDQVELFDINTASIGLFIITELDKFLSPKWRASNTFMRVRTIDGQN